ncbi:MAG TPA: hypothetical protein VFE58_16035 [Tepidisphaeraceae bacterium]|jgi:hypothetical protein|nr:hypothetical protein [Tepidisphaeraceae bacterium]
MTVLVSRTLVVAPASERRYVMPQPAARISLIRLACFAAISLAALAFTELQEGAGQWYVIVGWAALFAVPTVLLLWLLQRVARYRIPWFVELIGMPFALGGMIHVAVAIREIIRHSG